MSSLILSQDSHLMMLEIAVENLFVPWTSEIDKVILKKTVVLFRMLDKDWISLSPNRRDYRPYRGSNYENEKFYGGKSVVFSVPTDFFRKETNGVGVHLSVRKQVCKYPEMVSRETIGFVAVPVDNLLNSIAKQVRERDELAEHFSDLYKRQIISREVRLVRDVLYNPRGIIIREICHLRSMMGTYTLLDENFRDTAATISLYIRISYLGKCLITEITQVKSIHGAFYTRGESDEKQPYLTRQLTSKELQSRSWIDDLPHVPSGPLICRCEELVKMEPEDLTKAAVDVVAIKREKTPDKVADSVAISVPKIEDVAAIERIKPADVVADATLIETEKVPADVDSAAITIPKIDKDAAAIEILADTTVDSAAIPIAADTVAIKREEEEAIADSEAIPVAQVAEDIAEDKEKELDNAVVDSAISATNGAIIETGEAPADYEALGDRTEADADADALAERTTIPIMVTDNGIISDEQADRKDLIDSLIKDVEADAAAAAKTKGYAIKDNGERAFKKALDKSKRGRNMVTIGITEREKRILPLPSRLQTYPLCCQLQPHLTCFTDCIDISPCYCYWTACPLQFFCTVHKRVYNGASPFTATS